MKKQLLMTGLGVLLSYLSAQAQAFRPGYLVRVQGDTLRGEVEDTSWDEQPALVRQRPAPGAPALLYSAAELQSIRLTGGQYFRRELVPLDRSAQTNVNDLHEGLLVPATPKFESLLAEVLVDGPAQLLYTAVGGVHHYFVRRPGQLFLELTERLYLRRQQERLVVADANDYQTKLQRYFGDCPAAVAATTAATFTAPALAAVVQAYNQACDPARQRGPEYLAEPASRRTAISLGVVAGARYNSAALRSTPAGAPLADANLDGQLHPVGGVFLDMLLPARRGALHVAGLLATYGRQGAVPATLAGYACTLDTRQTVLEVRVGGRLFRPLGKQGMQLLLGTGITLPFALSRGTSTLRATSTSGGSAATLTSEVPTAYPASQLLPYLEVGVRQGRFTGVLDGRLGSEQGYFDLLGSATAGYAYATRPWYVSATVGVSLVQQR